MEQIEKENCRLFDSGRFNDIVLAYLVLSMKAANTPHKDAMELLDTMGHAFDEMTAEEALNRYRGALSH
ncbi:hypothetical protein SELR_pSRC400940 (plasmid) [Selenomonas ruminantium subsp. lactilytica TAM6421]|uniref:Uncharacterized protein n=1 Tax=Selenomonas ruminantium subsp. lactilytica (strain NBRC 103574 / TAM6421) TaxID=927704 RepID=I0GVF8_SELRL|nr:hypothetical protein [Selenomonas ruminantium]BAL84745.1 hypothetical protein SELR_pSRC400940 [Selenomonas ruminantium subsp. lactilytica TAM6421]